MLRTDGLNLRCGSPMGAEAGARVPADAPAGERDLRFGPTGSCLLYTSPSPRDATLSRMPSSA